MIVEELQSKSVKDVIKVNTSITITGTIGEAVEKMIKDKTGVIAGLEPGTNKFLGLFTKRHLLRRVILLNREKTEKTLEYILEIHPNIDFETQLDRLMNYITMIKIEAELITLLILPPGGVAEGAGVRLVWEKKE